MKFIKNYSLFLEDAQPATAPAPDTKPAPATTPTERPKRRKPGKRTDLPAILPEPSAKRKKVMGKDGYELPTAEGVVDRYLKLAKKQK